MLANSGEVDDSKLFSQATVLESCPVKDIRTNGDPGCIIRNDVSGS